MAAGLPTPMRGGGRRSRRAAFLVASLPTATNESLRAALARTGRHAVAAAPNLAGVAARPGDLVIGRIDVRPTLDGMQPGSDVLRTLAGRTRVMNGAEALVACHDKLITALLLRTSLVPHPDTFHALDPAAAPAFAPPYVVKPRFGSWGRDVVRCESRAELTRCLHLLGGRAWFRRHGALVQELIAPRGSDLRLVVAGGMVIGAVKRIAAPGEWRTNVALGATRRPTDPPADACELALRAADAVGGDLVGVDLLPEEDGWRVIEVNGAVEFTQDYALDERDVFDLAVEQLTAPARAALVP